MTISAADSAENDAPAGAPEMTMQDPTMLRPAEKRGIFDDEEGTPIMHLQPLIVILALLSLPLWAACLGGAWWLVTQFR